MKSLGAEGSLHTPVVVEQHHTRVVQRLYCHVNWTVFWTHASAFQSCVRSPVEACDCEQHRSNCAVHQHVLAKEHPARQRKPQGLHRCAR